MSQVVATKLTSHEDSSKSVFVSDIISKLNSKLSPASTNPLNRDNGDPLQDGDNYFNTSDKIDYVYLDGLWYSSVNNDAELGPIQAEVDQLQTDLSTVQSSVQTLGGRVDGKQDSAYGQTTITIRLGNIAIPEQFGAAGDGIKDDTQAIKDAIATGLPVEGLPGKVYGIAGNLQVTSPLFRLKNISLVQLTPNSTSRRTIFYNGTGKVYLENIIINRNGNGTGGMLNDAAGMWITGATGGYIRGCEIYGKDYGNGIALITCLDVLVENNYVHDIVGGTSTSAAITDDSIQGIWAYLCGRIILRGNKVVNLTNLWTGQASTYRYTRGISLGGCYDYELNDNYVDYVDQGIDSSGGDNNRRGIYFGNIVNNCYTWGLKFANTCVDILVSANRIRRAGCAAVVISAPTSNIGVGLDVVTQRITISGNELEDSGFGGNWDNFDGIGPCGILILTNATNYAGYPKGIKAINNRISGASGKMKYGMYSNTALTSNEKDWNESIGNVITDFTVAPYFGLGAAFCIRSTVGNQAVTASPSTTSGANDLPIVLEKTVADPGLMYSDSTNMVIRRSGWYRIDGLIRWNGSATGVCTQKIMINGNLPSDTEGITSFPGSGAEKRFPVSYKGFIPKGSTVRLHANSNVAAGIISATLAVEPCSSQSQ